MTEKKKPTALDRIRAEIERMAVANKQSPAIPKVKSGTRRIDSIRSLPEAVPERCRIFIVQGRDPAGHVVDPNRLVMYVCCDLVRACVDDETIYGVLVDDRYEISKHVLRGDDTERYVLRQIQRAKEFAIEPRLLELNEKHAVIESYAGGRCRVLQDPQDHKKKRSEAERDRREGLILQSFEDFRNRYQNQKVTLGFNQKGQLMETQLGTWWLDHAARRQYHSIQFAPGRGDEPGVYNLWRGFAFEAAPGNKHERYLAHIKENICNENEEVFQYLLKWMARAIQEPDAPGEVAIVLRGAKGTGKTIFADVFGQLFGRHYWAVANASHVVGNFNAHLRDCVVLFADEAFWAGDRRHESVLKALITSRTIVIESKGVDAETANNNVHLIMASNAEWVVPATYEERRFLMLDVAKTRQGDKKYFAEVMKEMEAGGFASLLHMLQKMDISDFDHRSVPDTDALQDQKFHSMEPHEEWWYRKLCDGHLQAAHSEWTAPIPKDAMIDDYLLYAQRVGTMRRANATRLHKFLDKCCPGLQQFHANLRGRDADGIPQIGRAVCYEFPPLDKCRAGFDDFVGGMTIAWPTIAMRIVPPSSPSSPPTAAQPPPANQSPVTPVMDTLPF